MSLTCTRLTVCTIAAVIIQITGLSLFILAFFPLKPALSGFSGPESLYPPGTDFAKDQNVTNLLPDELKKLYQELYQIPPSFDRLILMVIDGLPAEFVLGRDVQPPPKNLLEAMPYTQSLLANGMAIGYHAKAAPPTVTMPRLKAMLSGAIGGFLDVAFNFNTQALLDDNLVGQFFNIGWKMVMLGDETWLKLFPGSFTRHDGVSSFYVKDTVEVDYNVSRHLGDELNRSDWNSLILHYLGLDHVGHIGGRSSVLMGPKMKEMDEVIRTIHLNAVQSQEDDTGRTLLMVVSDHGMTDNGNHGGSSYEETDSLVLFVGLKQKSSDYDSVAHSNIFQHFGDAVCFRYTGIEKITLEAELVSAESNEYTNFHTLSNKLSFYILSDLKNLAYGGSMRFTMIATQVDIAPTLALLFGVPIPKNNVGILISEAFDSLSDEQKLRTLELNSWQLFKLLKAQLPGLSCGSVWSSLAVELPATTRCNGSDEEMFCCLFVKSTALHKAWMSKSAAGQNSKEYANLILAYDDFLKAASNWLSGRATYKPAGLLISGIGAMLLSCFLILRLLFLLDREVYPCKRINLFDLNYIMGTWYLDKSFVLAINFIIVLSMGSSSMVEEEHYMWYFLTSTFYLILLRTTSKSLTAGTARRNSVQIFCLIFILICGRIMRSWHRGGVNWAHLPDISKWLESTGKNYIKPIQLVAWLVIVSVSLYSVTILRSRKYFLTVFGFVFLVPGMLVLQHILKYQDTAFSALNHDATSMAQTIYCILGLLTLGTVFVLPWLMPVLHPKRSSDCETRMPNHLAGYRMKVLVVGFRDCMYIVGLAYILFWCLLQLVLQQPINTMPVSLLFVQILATVCYSFNSSMRFKQWVEVAALYYLGMAGHFSLGNTNTLATIDVAGAFIGMSSHSMFLSGILMFMITYASPMLALLSMVISMSAKDTGGLANLHDADFGQFLKTTAGFPCLVPLGINSIILTTYTIVLVLMRNHLFVWSVFSPKYVYVCATTACAYIGVSIVSLTAFYGVMVFALRSRTLQLS